MTSTGHSLIDSSTPSHTDRTVLQVLKVLMLICFIGILGLGAAALIAGHTKYWTYYVNNPGATSQLTFYRMRQAAPCLTASASCPQ